MFKPDLYTPKDISNWRELVSYQDHLPKATADQKRKWIYRGQKTHNKFDFASSLERAADGFGISLSDLPDRELKLLREFKRKLHHYTLDTPNNRDHLEWLAAMQHYGAPTRLLDWTYTFYVAAYFAIENADENGCDVWALNGEYFSARAALSPDVYAKLESEAERHKSDSSRQHEDKAIMLQDVVIEHLLKEPSACVHSANPFRLNERLTIQQGVFLFPGDITKPFEENLGAREYAARSADNLIRFRIKSDAKARAEILENLHSMNINRATLFPGLGGFAESLKARLAFLPEIAK